MDGLIVSRRVECLLARMPAQFFAVMQSIYYWNSDKDNM